MNKEFLFGEELIKKEKRIRGIIYYRELENFPYFLLLQRKSERYPGWEFVKEGIKREDELLEEALFRGVKEETGITRRDLINEPINVNIFDAIIYYGLYQPIRTYLLEVGNPPPNVVLSGEHSAYDWSNIKETYKRLCKRDFNRRRDAYTFGRIIKKEFPEFVLMFDFE